MADLEKEAEEYAKKHCDNMYPIESGEYAIKYNGVVRGFEGCANSNYVKQQVLKGKIEKVLQIYNDLFCNGINYLDVCIDHKKILEIELKQLETPKI